MKKTFTLVKNLRAYAAVAGLFFVAGAANAQVSHTDVDPDVTVTAEVIPGASYDIDIDGDDVTDFAVRVAQLTDFDPGDGSSFTGTSAAISVETEGAAVAVDDLDAELATAFSSGNSIGSSATWDPDFGTLYNIGTLDGDAAQEGNFINSTDKFVGVSFVSGGKTHFGYIQLSTTNNTVVVKAFAYEKTADAAINAGALTTGLSSYVKSNTTIKNINNTIVAEFASSFNGKIEVVNMNGQVVKSTSVNGVASSISMEGAPSGVYQVVVSGAEGFATEKVFIAAR